MSLARTQSAISGAVWLAIAVVSTVLVARLGVDDLAGDAGKATRSVLAAVILPGYAINFAIMVWARRARRRGDIDERDRAVEQRATEISAMVTIVAVYLFGIGLFERHAAAGSVPAGWFYVLAYGTVVMISLVYPAVSLFLDASGRVDG